MLVWYAYMHLTLENWKDLAEIGGVAIAALTLLKAVREFVLQSKEKRAKQFMDLRTAYRENKNFQEVINHLYGDKDFSSVPLATRIEFMGFFEDVAFLVQSKLLRREVAFYWFGGDAIAAWKDERFWTAPRDDKYWSLLRDFVLQMQEVETSFEYKRGTIKI